MSLAKFIINSYREVTEFQGYQIERARKMRAVGCHIMACDAFVIAQEWETRIAYWRELAAREGVEL